MIFFFIIYNTILNSVPTKLQYAHMWESSLGCGCREAWITQHQASNDWRLPEADLKRRCQHDYTR